MKKREFGLGAKHTFPHVRKFFFESCRHGIPQYHIDKALELSQKMIDNPKMAGNIIEF